jgi:hypothetical protein
MGDYLNDLVTKNIGTAEIIQPRRAARFEPVQMQSAFEIQAESALFQEASFEQENIIETTPHARPRRAREANPTEKNAVLSRPENSDEQIVETSFVSPPIKAGTSEIKPILSRSRRKSQETEMQREATNQNLSLPPASTISTIVTPKQYSSKFEETSEKLPDVIVHTPVQTRHAPQLKTDEFKVSEQKIFDEKKSNTKNLETTDSKAKDFDERIIEAVTPIIAKPRVLTVENLFEETAIQPMIKSPPRERSSNQFSDRAEISEVPTINVTIGRVEVRAVIASAPPKETRHVKPQTMSLDEYLQKRSNGGAP